MQILTDNLNDYNCTTHACDNGKNAIMSAITSKKSTLMSFFSDGSELKRKKREWEYFGKSLKFLGGVMDSDDRQILNRRVEILYENQKTIYEQLESVLSGLSSKSRSEALKAENGEFNEVESDLKHVHELIGLQALNERYEKISATIDGILRTILNRKIDGIFISTDLIERLRNLRNLACNKFIECIKHADADVQYDNNSKFTITLKIPQTDRSLKLYEITSIPTDLDSQILLLKFPHKFLAYDSNNKKIISVNNFNLCRKSDDDSTVIYCRAQDIIVNVNSDVCLEKAFRDRVIDPQICSNKMELLQADNFGVIEIASGRFWIHTKGRKDMVLLCDKNDQKVNTFTHSQIFNLNFGCHGVFRSDGIDLISYASESSQKLKSINASISKADFIDIIETMAVSNYLQNAFLINLRDYKVKGLDEIHEEVHSRVTANELKTIQAQHSEALLIVIIIAISFMLYVAMSKGKPYLQKFLPAHHEKDDVEKDDQDESVRNLNTSKM